MVVKTKKFTLSILITNQCNLNCLYCYEKDKNSNKPDLEFIKQIISEYLNSDKYEEVVIDFFGGEPFIAFNEIKTISEWVWSKTWKNNYLLFCTTNGTLVKGKIQEWLNKNKNRFWASLSLDGNRESHNINRSNSFDLIDFNFFKTCWPKQPIKMTISKETAPMLCENVKFIHSLGFHVAGANFAEGVDWEETSIKEIIFRQLELLACF